MPDILCRRCLFTSMSETETTILKGFSFYFKGGQSNLINKLINGHVCGAAGFGGFSIFIFGFNSVSHSLQICYFVSASL